MTKQVHAAPISPLQKVAMCIMLVAGLSLTAATSMAQPKERLPEENFSKYPKPPTPPQDDCPSGQVYLCEGEVENFVHADCNCSVPPKEPPQCHFFQLNTKLKGSKTKKTLLPHEIYTPGDDRLTQVQKSCLINYLKKGYAACYDYLFSFKHHLFDDCMIAGYMHRQKSNAWAPSLSSER